MRAEKLSTEWHSADRPSQMLELLEFLIKQGLCIFDLKDIKIFIQARAECLQRWQMVLQSLFAK